MTTGRSNQVLQITDYYNGADVTIFGPYTQKQADEAARRARRYYAEQIASGDIMISTYPLDRWSPDA